MSSYDPLNLPRVGDIICYNIDDGGADLPVEVVTKPTWDPPHTLAPELRHTTCWTIHVRYLVDDSTGKLHSVHSWGIREDELHLWTKVGVAA